MLVLDGRNIPVNFRYNSRARRFIMRLDRSGRGIVVTVPPRASRDEGLAFVVRSQGWVIERIPRERVEVQFADGMEFPLRGTVVKIAHESQTRGTVRLDRNLNRVFVNGAAEHLQRRLVDWLKAEARRDLLSATERYARVMNVKFKRISIRDQKSRWGSCASDGSLSYSWRLVMAPDYVLDYVAAHEVAHLRYMDHSRKFWRLVLGHCAEASRAKVWLKANGSALHRYAPFAG